LLALAVAAVARDDLGAKNERLPIRKGSLIDEVS